MAKQKDLIGGEIDVTQISEIKKKAKAFVASEFERDNYPLLKKKDLEGQTFIVFDYSKITKDGQVYYNIKAIDRKDNPFCFNGSNVLVDQLEENGYPCTVKLVRKERDDKLRPYYWVFAAPEA